MYGPEGINFYALGKVVTYRWPEPATSVVDLGFPRTRWPSNSLEVRRTRTIDGP
jgi:hypothetical protein